MQENADQGDHGLYDKIPAWERHDRDTGSLWDWVKRQLLGHERTPIPSYIGLIEDPPPNGERPKTGICCSGGGIRSAAFNLGALQELQGRERLGDAKYLAAVSGGSYIAAAFSMVAKTKKTPNDPESDDSEPDLFTKERPPFYHGSPEEQYLRNRSSYMAPGGVGRARLFLRVTLGLLVNLAFIGTGIVLVAWVLAVFYRVAHGPLQDPAKSVEAATSTLEWWTVGGITAVALAVGLVSLFLSTRWERTKHALETLSIYLLGAAALVAMVTVVLPELVEFLRNRYGSGGTETTVTTEEAQGGAGAVAGGGFGALLFAVLIELRSTLTVAATKGTAWYQRLGKSLRRAVTTIAAWVIGPLLLGSTLVLALLAMVSSEHISLWPIVGVGIVFALFLAFSDVTAWSLHPFYRRRLCTAFALKRVRREGREPGDFGIALERDYRKLVPLSESGVEPGSGALKTWPTLVVCAAANVSDPGATPPGRSVTSFTFSPVAMGGPLVGGVRTQAFENYIAPSRRRDFTLAAAVAMSGAAISPSMGKETRGSIRFLLGLGNVRLGVWVPNPRCAERWLEPPAGSRPRLRHRIDQLHDHKRGRVTDLEGAVGTTDVRFRKWATAPRAGPWYLIKEMLGFNSVNDPYLYVTDGGHYENLGLVELLRRGCTEIFCFDASGGTRLDALGDAIALARSELNVEIEIPDVALLEEDDDRIAERCCVRGKITYPEGQEGVLIYARTVVTEQAAYDVQAFRIRDDAFPHHSTLDQLYTDEKFEAYRELGAHAGRAAVAESDEARVEIFKLDPATGRTPRTEHPAEHRDLLET